MLDDRVRLLEEEALRLVLENQIMLIVIVRLFNELMPADQKAKTTMIDDVEALVNARLQNLRSAMSPLETATLGREMRRSVSRMMRAMRDELGLPRE